MTLNSFFPMKTTLSQSGRRTWVVALYVSFVLAAATYQWMLLRHEWPVITIILFMLFGGLSLLAFARLFYHTKLWNLGHSLNLDERQNMVRDQAYRTGYSTLATLVFTSLVYTNTASDLGWWTPAPATMGTLTWAFLLLSLTLPATIIA